MGRLALEVAAVGGHHVALVGAPGVGKTLLAERLPGLLPDLDERRRLEVAALHCVAGRTARPDADRRRPPFRAPHHSASVAAILGCGRTARRVTAGRGHAGAPRRAVPGRGAGVRPTRASRACGSRWSRARLRWTAAAGRDACRPGSSWCWRPTRARAACDRRRGPAARARRRPSAATRRGSRARCSTASTSGWPCCGRPMPNCRRRAGEGSRRRPRSGARGARPARARRFADVPLPVNAEIPAGELRRHWRPDPGGVELLRDLDRASANLRGPDRVLRMAWSVADLAGRAAARP